MIDFIFLVALFLSVIGVFAFGILAALQVDQDKMGALSKNDVRFFGPLVPEKILKPQGLKWAKLRNVCVVVVFVLPITFALFKHR